MWKSFRTILLVMTTFTMISCAEASRELTTTPIQDEAFRQLREAARKHDTEKAIALANSLQNYPISSYVDYYRLKSNLRNASDEEVSAYLAKYDGTAIADRLRNDWLLIQGERQNWDIFDREYPKFVLNDDVQVKCYALISKAEKGINVVNEAKELLGFNIKKAGETAYTLLYALALKQQMSMDDIWYFVRLAADTNLPSLASRAASLAGASANTVTSALSNPSPFLAKGPGKDRNSHEIYLLALGKAAVKDRSAAITSINTFQSSLTESETAIGWSRIAIPASVALAPDAIEYWKKATTDNVSPYAHEWRVRTALRHEDWPHVKTWIDLMTPYQQTNSTWIYWKARALKEEGKWGEANDLFKSIEDESSFYGMLAEEELNGWVMIPSSHFYVSDSELNQMADTMVLARKFYAMDWQFEAVREWNWQLRHMAEDRQILIAAELARKIGRLDRMIYTSDRTKNTIVSNQRFPTPYLDYFKASTDELGLDIAWAYGLVRQESRFVTAAKSHVGAQGLMQVMPSTAKYIAQKIGMTDYSSDKITDMQTNIKLGTAYLDMTLRNLNGSQAMASAGYNAGPGRPKRWKSTLPHAVEGAIFAESIPFVETRDYVKKVLYNTTYYAGELGSRTQSLKKRLGTIEP